MCNEEKYQKNYCQWQFASLSLFCHGIIPDFSTYSPGKESKSKCLLCVVVQLFTSADKRRLTHNTNLSIDNLVSGKQKNNCRAAADCMFAVSTDYYETPLSPDCSQLSIVVYCTIGTERRAAAVSLNLQHLFYHKIKLNV